MRARDHPQAAAAMLLVGLAALHAVLDATAGSPQRAFTAVPAVHPLPPPGSSARKTMDWCLQNVTMIHDVYWASACAVDAEKLRARRRACAAGKEAHCQASLEPPDDSPDCTLDTERARPLNAARAKAEQQCLDEAMAH